MEVNANIVQIQAFHIQYKTHILCRWNVLHCIMIHFMWFPNTALALLYSTKINQLEKLTQTLESPLNSQTLPDTCYLSFWWAARPLPEPSSVSSSENETHAGLRSDDWLGQRRTFHSSTITLLNYLPCMLRVIVFKLKECAHNCAESQIQCAGIKNNEEHTSVS